MAKYKKWHFDLGNSCSGPVGCCAVVNAKTKQEALQKLSKFLPEEYTMPRVLGGDGDIIYICVYFNSDAIKLEDIRLEPL